VQEPKFLHSIEEELNSKCIRKRCTRQFAPTAERNAMFPSNPTEADPYTAKNVILNEDRHEDTKLIS
jgi:hypothetical protein